MARDYYSLLRRIHNWMATHEDDLLCALPEGICEGYGEEAEYLTKYFGGKSPATAPWHIFMIDATIMHDIADAHFHRFVPWLLPLALVDGNISQVLANRIKWSDIQLDKDLAELVLDLDEEDEFGCWPGSNTGTAL
ncbi:MAG: hypothetical protein AMXMBFR81_08930 [Chthonomonas sp.]